MEIDPAAFEQAQAGKSVGMSIAILDPPARQTQFTQAHAGDLDPFVRQVPCPDDTFDDRPGWVPGW